MARCVAGKNDLETWCKDNDQMKYLEEWNADKNVGISPGMIAKSSRKEVWWRCDKGHEWMAPVNARTGNKYGCPYCSGRRVLVGYNDFATNYPDISKEWHPTKNDGIAPTDFTSRSKQKVWWQCEKGHEWQATICDRTLSNSGCPICAKELKTSFPATGDYSRSAPPDSSSLGSGSFQASTS